MGMMRKRQNKMKPTERKRKLKMKSADAKCKKKRMHCKQSWMRRRKPRINWHAKRPKKMKHDAKHWKMKGKNWKKHKKHWKKNERKKLPMKKRKGKHGQIVGRKLNR